MVLYMSLDRVKNYSDPALEKFFAVALFMVAAPLFLGMGVMKFLYMNVEY